MKPKMPGTILREKYMTGESGEVQALATKMGVSRVTLSRLINGHVSLTPTMAVRLELHVGGTAKGWLELQNAVDLWEEESK